MPITALLIANRGEIAIRIARAASDLGLRTVAVFAEDDAESLHTRVADEAVPLEGLGAAAYLNIANVVAAAKAAGCDAVHPGYGFLAERADFAEACAAAGLTFVGPTPSIWRYSATRAGLARKHSLRMCPSPAASTGRFRWMKPKPSSPASATAAP